MKVIAVANRKGGVGKTTTAHMITAGLSLYNYRTLAIDLDAQRNLTGIMRASGKNGSVFGVLTKDTSIEAVIEHTPDGDIVPASKALSGADAVLSETGKEYRLREALEPLKDRYDFVIIDCPPALGILTVNALTAADSVLIPAQADILSVQGVQDLWETVEAVKKYCNRSLKIEGILLTRYNGRTIISREVKALMGELAAQMDTRLFETTIREASAVKEAQIKRTNIFSYSPAGGVTGDSRAFLTELTGIEAFRKESPEEQERHEREKMGKKRRQAAGQPEGQDA